MPNTREKLIEVKKALEFCFKQGMTSDCNGCAYKGHEGGVCMDVLMEDAFAVIKHVEEKQATSKWIPVTERLPEKDGNYLIFERGYLIPSIRVLSFAKDGRKVDKYDFHREWKNVWYRYDSEWGHLTIDNVTHWMPLPEPPKGE